MLGSRERRYACIFERRLEAEELVERLSTEPQRRKAQVVIVVALVRLGVDVVDLRSVVSSRLDVEGQSRNRGHARVREHAYVRDDLRRFSHQSQQGERDK